MSKLEQGLIALTPERAQTFARILGCGPIELLPALSAAPASEHREVELLQIMRALTDERQDMLLRLGRTLLGEATGETPKTKAR